MNSLTKSKLSARQHAALLAATYAACAGALASLITLGLVVAQEASPEFAFRAILGSIAVAGAAGIAIPRTTVRDEKHSQEIEQAAYWQLAFVRTKRAVLHAASTLTGYPAEMLDVSLPLEGGLGIDAVKLIEIVQSALKDAGIPADRIDQTEILRYKTLDDVIHAVADLKARAMIASVAELGGLSFISLAREDVRLEPARMKVVDIVRAAKRAQVPLSATAPPGSSDLTRLNSEIRPLLERLIRLLEQSDPGEHRTPARELESRQP